MVKKFLAFYETRKFFTVKTAAFWNATPCSVVKMSHAKRETYYFLRLADTFETSMNHRAALLHIPK
jgi:hypothetical protein